MIKSIKYFLNKHFYIDTLLSNKLILSVIHGLFILLFLNFFKPFKLDNLKEYFFNYSLLIAVLYVIVLFLIFVILEKINYKKWTYGSIIIVTLFFIFILSFVTWYSGGIYKDIYGLKRLSFLLFYRYTSYVTIFSIPLLFVINDELSKLKIKRKKVIEKKLSKSQEENIIIYSENKKENIRLNINKLIYISITGNYVSFYITTDKGIKELVFRNTLSNIIKQIKKYPFIFRCHKSYIINTNYIDSISGNARGYFLKANKIKNLIPVSRKFNKEYLEKIIN